MHGYILCERLHTRLLNLFTMHVTGDTFVSPVTQPVTGCAHESVGARVVTGRVYNGGYRLRKCCYRTSALCRFHAVRHCGLLRGSACHDGTEEDKKRRGTSERHTSVEPSPHTLKRLVMTVMLQSSAAANNRA